MHPQSFSAVVLLASASLSFAFPAASGHVSINPTRAVLESLPLLARDGSDPANVHNGTCSASHNEPLSKPRALKKEEKCGPMHESRQCSNNQCCSHAGYCGTGKDFCAVPQNCQREFGRCDSDTEPAGISTIQGTRAHAGGLPSNEPIAQCREPRTIALTYDDGPSDNTQTLLDILRNANAKATFFIAGNNNGKQPIDQTDKWIKAIKRMEVEGHQIASHTWSHPHLDRIDSEQRVLEMTRNERALENIIGKYPTYMRAPYIECGQECMDDMNTLGYHVTNWGVDSNDWAHGNDLEAMKQAVDEAFQREGDNGHIMLVQHDTIPLSAHNLTQHVLQRVGEKGWRAVTLSECLGEPMNFAYRSTPWVDGASIAKGGCMVSDGKACGQLLPFNGRQQCFQSAASCLKQLESRDFATKKASMAYRQMREVCHGLTMFCAECGRGKAQECKAARFTHKVGG